MWGQATSVASVGIEEGGVVEYMAASAGAAAAVGPVGSDPVHAATVHPEHVHRRRLRRCRHGEAKFGSVSVMTTRCRLSTAADVQHLRRVADGVGEANELGGRCRVATATLPECLRAQVMMLQVRRHGLPGVIGHRFSVTS